MAITTAPVSPLLLPGIRKIVASSFPPQSYNLGFNVSKEMLGDDLYGAMRERPDPNGLDDWGWLPEVDEQ